MKVAGRELADVVRVGGGDICGAWRAVTTHGVAVFAKSVDGAPPDFFHAEVRGLDLLRVAGGPRVPGVVAVNGTGLVLEWVEPGRPDVAAAADLGRRLANM